MTRTSSSPIVRPLFAQIKELIVERVKAGEWQPGEPLPSENDFAEFYGVSQGTVRKAIAEMATENLVERFRGKGTFVTSQTREREHSHFFHLLRNDGVKELPGTQPISCRRQKANRDMRKRLLLESGTEVAVLERLRLIGGVPLVFETITVSEELFPGLCASLEGGMPNELYPHYERKYGVRVISAVEHLRAVAASESEARALDTATGTALLEIDRLAVTYGEKPVEWRRSRCLTTNHYYLSKLV